MPRARAWAMMAARRKPVVEWDLAELALADAVEADAGALLGNEGAGVRLVGATRKPAREQGVIVTDTGDGGRRLADYLQQVM